MNRKQSGNSQGGVLSVDYYTHLKENKTVLTDVKNTKGVTVLFPLKSR